MIGLIARFLLILAGFLTSLFVSREALHFGIVQMIIAVLLFTFVVMAAAFWPELMNWFKRKNK